MSRILLLIAANTYRAEDFLAAARQLGIEVIVGSNSRQALEEPVPDATLEVDFSDREASVQAIVELAGRRPFDAIVAAEDDGVLLAAAAAQALSLPHNTPDSAATARYKHLMRAALAQAEVASPAFRLFSVADDPEAAADQVDYPCVLKPVFLAASRGVIRANRAAEFVDAFNRIVRILAAPDVQEKRDPAARLILAEDFVPGDEVALEGVLTEGRLKVLALFEKPEPLDGPYFEESLYVTPSQRSAGQQAEIAECVHRAASAIGLWHGPVHAELRINAGGIHVIEIAPRSIGGLCSRTLRFGAGISLEELILRHATGRSIDDLSRESRAAGVLMIPIPRAGTLKEVNGVAEAELLEGIRGLKISIPLGQEVLPLPEGHRYLGFIFASGATTAEVEAFLRKAHRKLDFLIEPAGG